MVGLQLLLSSGVVIEGMMVGTRRRGDTPEGGGVFVVAYSYDAVIVNVARGDVPRGVVASAGGGGSSEEGGAAMTRDEVIGSAMGRANGVGGLVLGFLLPGSGRRGPRFVFHDPFDMLAASVGAGRPGLGIQSIRPDFVVGRAIFCHLPRREDGSDGAGLGFVALRRAFGADWMPGAGWFGLSLATPRTCRTARQTWATISLAATCTMRTGRRFTSASTIRRSGSCTSHRLMMSGVASTFRSSRHLATQPTASTGRST